MTWVLAIFLVLSFICNILLAGTLHVAMMDRMRLKRDLKMYKDAFSRALQDTSTYQYVKETLEAIARHEKGST